jgi:hypothetical protein
MKQLLTLLFMMTLAVSANSQWWFDAGVKGAYGPTMMYDQNVFDDGDYKHALSTGTSFGGRLGFNYGYHVGLSLEYGSATSNQEFNYQNQDPYNSFKWKTNDFATLFRYSGNGAYIEAGAKFSNVKSVELTTLDQPAIDVSENFNKNYTSGIFGFGSYLMGSELLTLNLGIRVHWGFTDMVNETGKENDYPFVVEDNKDPSKKTLATAAQLQVELNYAFGRFSKEACHDRWKLILFQ